MKNGKAGHYSTFFGVQVLQALSPSNLNPKTLNPKPMKLHPACALVALRTGTSRLHLAASNGSGFENFGAGLGLRVTLRIQVRKNWVTVFWAITFRVQVLGMYIVASYS